MNVRPISVLVPPDRSNDVPEVLNLIGSGESIRHYEPVRLRKDGARLDVSLTVSRIRDAAGHVVGASTVARDITERKRAQEALRVSEERYRHLFAQSPDPVLLYDAATLELLDVNEAAIQQYGYSHDEFTGLTVNEIRPAGDVPALLEPAARPLQPFVGVRRHRKKDGSVFH